MRATREISSRDALPGRLREVAILTVAAHWRAQYEWWAHARIARREGLAVEAIAAIKNGNAPTGTDGLAEVHGLVSELLRDRQLSDATYGAAHTLLGDAGVVELVTLTGYYGLISALLNGFQVPLPDGEALPFADA